MSEPSLKNGVICSQDDWELSQNTSYVHCLTRGQSIGLMLPVETGIVSLIAVLTVGILIVRNIRRYSRQFSERKWKLFQEPCDVFMVSLFTFEAMQAIGAIMNIRWIGAGKVYSGPFCTVQGSIKQLGATGVGMSALAIAIHTFVALWWGRGVHATKIAWLVVTFIWLFAVLFVVIGNTVNSKKFSPYEIPTPYCSWIGNRYQSLRLVGECGWLWLTLFISFAAYLPLYFWMRGNLVAGRRCWYRWSWRSSRSGNATEDRLACRRALVMLAYPISYSFFVLPLFVVRWCGYQRTGTPFLAIIFAVSIFNLSGLVNVLLFLGTRPERLLFANEPEPSEEIALPPANRETPGWSHTPNETINPSENLAYCTTCRRWGWDSHSKDSETKLPVV